MGTAEHVATAPTVTVVAAAAVHGAFVVHGQVARLQFCILHAIALFVDDRDYRVILIAIAIRS
ncbi:hypothetical protein LBMAG49_06950 [Planctomycetota bacterium]|nr:hypothetical protein LBMAG49_06950 [Planctomycetota bacterium]